MTNNTVLIETNWFKDDTLLNAVGHLTFFAPPEDTTLTDSDFEEMFTELDNASSQLQKDEYHANLRMLSESPVGKIKQLATEKLHSLGELTSEEQKQQK